ncbi:TonB-dependent receptor plug domain-containing protein [Xanthomarina sp. F1114]|uniref:TonB-dependent receptor plug domain-containing protein n=1 Tax=Xanthomarina sp. F1114 TaxID=2996019 RepID=UPI00225E0563|nr:TonB-dependent receptor plug domain-containing protein [Xanthomarina sp. F1114]MCX7548690.1 TonB-dependent receptor plug domain-containing protein [Xanthomarina sp. F1114]
MTGILFAQKTPDSKDSLETILSTIEEQYNITFSYADATIQNKEILAPAKTLSRANLIIYLESETQLIFEAIDSTSYAIRPVNFTDITKTQYLDEVLISNYLTEGISLQADGTSLIRLKSFGILPGLIEADVLQTVQALPGITSSDERVSNLNIRGGTNDQNLILWDGVKMYQSGHFFGLISAFNPLLIDYVEVSKNGSSAEFNEGVSGIINMKSSNKVSKKFKAGVGANMLAIDAFLQIPISKKLSVQLAGRRSITDAFNTPTYQQYFKRIFKASDLNNPEETVITNNENFYFYDISAKANYDISENDKLEVSFLLIDNALDYQETASFNNKNESSNSQLTQGSLAINGIYTRNWNSKLKTIFQAYYSKYDLYANHLDISNDQNLIQENQVTDGSFKAHALYNINDYLNYFGGYNYSEIGISNLEDVSNPAYRRYIKEVLRSHGLFSELTYKSRTGNTRARLGLRANYIEKFADFYFEPRVSFNQIIADDFRIEVLGELNSQTTSQIIDLQNDFLGIEKKRWILANNKDIPIIKSQQVSTGIHYNNKQLLISLVGYIKQVEDITSRSQGFQNQFQLTNTIGEYTVKGLDFLINKQFNRFGTWFSYSYSKNDYTFPELNEGNTFPNNVDIKHLLNVSGTYTLDQLKFALGMNWHSGKPTTLLNSEQSEAQSSLVFEAPNASNLSDYWRTDFSATYNFKFSEQTKAEAGVSVWNIFDTKNVINSYYIMNAENEIIQVENMALGITPNVSFRVFF